eukprot:symbB.v1.2.033544.t1/scaffold4182.1/size43443/5
MRILAIHSDQWKGWLAGQSHQKSSSLALLRNASSGASLFKVYKGGARQAWEEVPRAWSTRMNFHEFVQWTEEQAIIRSRGFAVSTRCLFDALDIHGSGTVTEEDFCFLDHWAHKRLKKPLPAPPVWKLNWTGMSGRDVACFVEKCCGLPQYSTAMAQINGGTLQELSSKGMLQKGLTRAGVRDADHQRLISQAVVDLERWTPEEVSSWYQENCMKAPVIPMAPKMPKPRRVGPKQKFYAKITGPMTPRQKSSTEMGLQRSSKVSGHFSEERFTPRLYEKTYDFPSRGYGNVELQELDDEVVIPPLKLRKYLAGSVLDYEGMRDSDSPPAGVVVKGLRGLQTLKEEEEKAATQIQATFRQKKAKQEVAKKQQEKEEESAAAAKIQARYRGKKAGKEVQEMREQKGAATAIQARYRQRAAQREVNALRKEKQEPPTFQKKLGKVNGSS